MKKSAFTFIELIVAVTIFSIITVSIYSTFNAGLRIWLRTNPMIEVNQAMRVFFNIISLDLKNAVKYNSDSPAEANFEGGDKRISFMTLVDASGDDETPPHKELARVIYDFHVTYEDRSQRTAVRRLVATRKEGLDEKRAVPSEVLTGIEEKDFSFEFCYIEGSKENKEYSYQWKDTWEDEEKANIPRGVKVRAGSFEKTIFVPSGELGGAGK